MRHLEMDVRGPLDITWNAEGTHATFVRGEIPIQVVGRQGVDRNFTHRQAGEAILERYADLWGLRSASELDEVRLHHDRLGMSHLRLRQLWNGIPVYQGTASVHFSASGEEVVAISNGLIAGLVVTRSDVRLTASEAADAARTALPSGQMNAQPQLYILPERRLAERHGDSVQGRMVWMVEIRDDQLPARNIYAIDSATGEIVRAIDALVEGRSRQTHNAFHAYTLPGTLVRSEGAGPTGDADVDDGHDFAGETYDYFWLTHQRDSYDDAGAAILSTVHYGSGYQNAFWNGFQMVYGDGFVVRDVVAHEITHALTERTANLEYRWQSGALNESFSDIFGAMVDRDDWLMGEDLPIGAIRSLENPGLYGDPAHVDDWVETCSDKEGVHTNSGIHNRAFFNVAASLGKDKAELIFFRALTSGYLNETSSMEDARAAALQSATDLYGSTSGEYSATDDGFRAVGLDGVWQPQANSCGCAFNALRSDESVFESRGSVLRLATTLYRLRDQMLRENGPARYLRSLYNDHMGRISRLLLQDRHLRSDAAKLLSTTEQGMREMLDGKRRDRPTRIDRSLIREVRHFLDQLREADLATEGGGSLAATIEREIRRLDWRSLAGSTYSQGWRQVVENLPNGESRPTP